MREFKMRNAALVVFVVLSMTTKAFGVNVDWVDKQDYLGGLELSRETSDDLKSLINQRSTPIIRNVTITPEAPGAGEPATVVATIVSPPKMVGDDISDVVLNYSLNNGNSWSAVVMEHDEEDDSIWRGTIPGQPSGTSVIYGLQATNFSDESSVEVICKMEVEASKRFGLDTGVCKNNKARELCEAKKPSTCMFPMSVSSDEFKFYDNTLSGVPDDLNIRAPRVGYGEDEIYIDFPLKGKVSPGTLSPPNIHVYVVGWENPDMLGNETNSIDAIFQEGAVMIYAPLNHSEPCAIYYLKAHGLDKDRTSGRCDTAGNRMIFSIKEKAFDPNPSKTLEFLVLTFTQRGISPPDARLEDASLFTRVYFVDRGYIVP